MNLSLLKYKLRRNRVWVNINEFVRTQQTDNDKLSHESHAHRVFCESYKHFSYVGWQWPSDSVEQPQMGSDRKFPQWYLKDHKPHMDNPSAEAGDWSTDLRQSTEVLDRW